MEKRIEAYHSSHIKKGMRGAVPIRYPGKYRVGARWQYVQIAREGVKFLVHAGCHELVSIGKRALRAKGMVR